MEDGRREGQAIVRGRDGGGLSKRSQVGWRLNVCEVGTGWAERPMVPVGRGRVLVTVIVSPEQGHSVN